MIDLADVASFLEVAKEFKIPSKELTFFDVGLRGHFENPTTELLSFFLDPRKEHGLGETFIRGFLTALNIAPEDTGNFVSVDREVVTNFGRIDLLLIFEKTVFVAECKIYHDIINPFEDYQNFIEGTYPEKRKIYILLSPDGKSHSIFQANKIEEKTTLWQGVSYFDLARCIKEEQTYVDIEQSGKWYILADELLLQFFNYSGVKMTNEQFDFVLRNFESIEDIKKLQQSFYNEILERVKTESLFDDVKIKYEVWGDARVLRFSRMVWSGVSSCVIYFSSNQKLPLMARVWSGREDADVFIEKLRPKLKELSLTEVSRSDAEKNWSRWDWHLSNMDLTIKLIAKFLSALNEIEISR